MKIIFASHTCFNPSLVVGSHHLSRNLAKAGHEVLHLSAPLTLLHAANFRNGAYQHRFKIWRSGGQKIETNLSDYVPLSLFPWQLARKLKIGPRNLFLNSLPSISSTLRRFGFEAPDLLLVDEPRMAGIESICRPKKLFYRSTDLSGDFKKDPTILKAERWLIERANGLIGTSEPVLASLRAVAPEKRFLLLENGVDLDFFSDPQPEPALFRTIPYPRAIYVGAVDERFDFQAIEALSQARPDLSIVIIGPVSVPVPAMAKNVYLPGAKPYLEIPAYLQHSQVGLLPLNTHLANRGRSPMKLYEYGAAGLPVVASATEELIRRQEPFTMLYAQPEKIGEAVENALRDPQSRAAARKAALSRDWKTLTDKLLSFTESSS